MDTKLDITIPSWKKELILRRQNKNKSGSNSSNSSSSSYCMLDGGQQTVEQQRSVNVGVNVKEYNLKYPTYTQVLKQRSSSANVQCDLIRNSNTKLKMVQENFLTDYNEDVFDVEDVKTINDNDLDDLQYGPGIVNKLRNRYMSLALRATNTKTRPGLYRMRNATSFEHLLDNNDDDDDDDKSSRNNRFFESNLNGNAKNVATTTIAKNRYKKSTHGDLKRARSEEAISTIINDYDLNNESRTKRETIHEDMFIFGKEGNIGQPWKCKDNENIEIPEQKKVNNTHIAGQRYNRPLRVQPVMNEKEKPPANFVKQTKLLYEKKPDSQPKGEVANKIAAYKNLLQNAKKKPSLSTNLSRQKPIAKTDALVKKYNYKSNLPSPNVMPDLLLSSPITSPTNKISPLESFIKAEVENAIPSIESCKKTKTNTAESATNKNVSCQTKITNDIQTNNTNDSPNKKLISEECQNNIRKAGSTFTYDFSKSNDSSKDNSQQPNNNIKNQHQIKDAQQQQIKIQQSIKNQTQDTKQSIKETKQIKETRPQIKETRQVKDTQQQSINENQQSIKEIRQPIKETQQSFKETQQLIKDNQQQIKENLQPIKEKQQSIKEKQQPIKENQQPIRENQQAIKENQQQIKENQPIKENQQQIQATKQQIQGSKQQIGGIKQQSQGSKQINENQQQQSKEVRPKIKEIPRQQHNKEKERQQENSLTSTNVIKENNSLVLKDDVKLNKISENIIINNDKCVDKTFNTNSLKGDLIKNKVDVPKKKNSRVHQDNNQSSNTIVFNFTQTAKGVPDYIGNDGRIQVQKIEKPKVKILRYQCFTLSLFILTFLIEIIDLLLFNYVKLTARFTFDNGN